jgi:hypothetical protein
MIFCSQPGEFPLGKLTATAVRAAKYDPAKGKRPIRIGDGDGLYLQVASGDTKSWLFRFMLRGKSREMGLGPVGDPPDGVPLAKARINAAEARALLRDGKDPLAERQASRLARHWPKPRPASAPLGLRRRHWWTASDRGGGTPSTPRNGWPPLKHTHSR